MFALGYRKQHLFKIFTRNIRIHPVVILLITTYQTAEIFVYHYVYFTVKMLEECATLGRQH